MKRVLEIAILIVTGVPLGMGQTSPWKAYELYSWQRPDGGWNFCMLPSPSGVNITAEEVFSCKSLIRGAGDLKRRIAGLPAETTMYWLDRFTDTHQKSGKDGMLAYPPSKVVEEIKQQAKRHKIKLDVSSGALTP